MNMDNEKKEQEPGAPTTAAAKLHILKLLESSVCAVEIKDLTRAYNELVGAESQEISNLQTLELYRPKTATGGYWIPNQV